MAEEMIGDAAKKIPDRSRSQLIRRNPKMMQRHEAEALYQGARHQADVASDQLLSPIGPMR